MLSVAHTHKHTPERKKKKKKKKTRTGTNLKVWCRSWCGKTSVSTLIAAATKVSTKRRHPSGCCDLGSSGYTASSACGDRCRYRRRSYRLGNQPKHSLESPSWETIYFWLGGRGLGGEIARRAMAIPHDNQTLVMLSNNNRASNHMHRTEVAPMAASSSSSSSGGATVVEGRVRAPPGRPTLSTSASSSINVTEIDLLTPQRHVDSFGEQDVKVLPEISEKYVTIDSSSAVLARGRFGVVRKVGARRPCFFFFFFFLLECLELFFRWDLSGTTPHPPNKKI